MHGLMPAMEDPTPTIINNNNNDHHNTDGDAVLDGANPAQTITATNDTQFANNDATDVVVKQTPAAEDPSVTLETPAAVAADTESAPSETPVAVVATTTTEKDEPAVEKSAKESVMDVATEVPVASTAPVEVQQDVETEHATSEAKQETDVIEPEVTKLVAGASAEPVIQVEPTTDAAAVPTAETETNKSEENNSEEKAADAAKEEGAAPMEVSDTSKESAEAAEAAKDNNASSPTAVDGETQSTASSTPLGQSMGAQILMNRFSTWRTTANESATSILNRTQTNPILSERAKQAEEYAQRMRMRFQQTMRVSASSATDAEANTPVKKGAGEKKSKDEEKVPPPGKKEESISVKASTSTGDDGEGESLERNESQESKSTFSSGNTGDHSSTVGGDEDTMSDATSDGTGTTSSTVTPYTRVRMRAVLNRASVAGSVVAESMATSFRGRYTADAASGTTSTDGKVPESPAKPVPESQVALILKSRVGEYMQEILNQLEDHEFAMLLGRGMLGVNLKQCYLKNHGIFVDYLVAGGQAEQSGLVRSGDLMVRLGEKDFRKGTIQEVPHEIAKAKRPAVLVMSTGTPVPLERVNYLDVAVAMMHRARKHLEQQTKSKPLTSKDADGTCDSQAAAGDSEGREIPEKEEKSDDPLSTTPKSVSNVTIPINETADSFVSPPWPNLEIRKEFVDEAPLRCHDKFVVSELADMLDLDSNFRAAVQNALLVCALDSRRLPFLARHFSGEEFQMNDPNQADSSSMTPSAKLMLFLELASFLDLYEVTPTERLKEAASRIAYKFFLPTKIGSRLQPPLFDFHHIAPDSSLRHLEAVLSGKSQTIPKDIFLDFQKSVVDSLTSAPFLSFLCSSDCARMRAYLRDTSPFIKLPLKAMVDSVCHKGTGETPAATEDEDVVGASKNCLAYILLYLICRMEKEANGEYDFGIDMQDNRRVLGAPNDLCCSIFIKRELLPAIKSTRDEIKSSTEGSLKNEGEKLVSIVGQFWDIYVADNVELSAKRTEIESMYDQVRVVLQDISKQVFATPTLTSKDIARLLLESKLEETSGVLANELLYEYASNLNTKFRDNKLHEWMCSELCKVVASDPSWYQKMPIPQLPPGCLKRMLRKSELPVGISSHKPYKEMKTNDTERQNHNAEWAVVFGSAVGPELASQMPVPGLDSLDVRRYTCQPVALDRDHNYDDFRPEQVLPAMFESYAVVPPSKLKPFRTLVDADRISVDGWEVSLVTFTMPNADSSSSSGDATESALFSVSLCFQRPAPAADIANLRSRVQTEMLFEDQSSTKTDGDGTSWVSPIEFETGTDGDDSRKVRRIKTRCDVPTFSRRLREKSWAERVSDEEHRDPSQPFVIGIALVSSRNVVFAMRDTLTRLLFDFSRQPGQTLDDTKSSPSCNALVEVLGAFSYQDNENEVLKCILEPYMRYGSSTWVDRPILDQEQAFESHALKLLTDCLPPIPLALLFVTALLEQKVVLSSSRRSVLHAASCGLTTLLRPLKWSHLLVPLVPGALAADLIQYPAPFILGVPSEDADNMDLLGNLPRDVTLVDLDVGRVILAPDFGKDNEMVRGTQDADATARALRSQVLYLAQGLGTVFGNSLRPDSWLCDGISAGRRMTSDSSDFDRLRESARSFVVELLEGTSSCCFWFEEATHTYGTASEPTVLFDEDKFFQIKHHRATQAWKHLFPREKNTGALALNLEDFDLILESFLRCQNLSLHINTLPKADMFYH